jgi:hypothetical protein
MPVMTRSMRKNNILMNVEKVKMNVEKSKLNQPINENLFTMTIKNFIDKINTDTCSERKISFLVEMYKIINNEFERLLNLNPKKWVLFASILYNKTIEFQKDLEKKPHLKYSYNQVLGKTPCLLEKAKNFLVKCLLHINATSPELINPYLINMRGPDFIQADLNIETARPRRNIPRVDYTGMDMIEPESEYDGITNIWADPTIDEDPDYTPF